MDKNGKKRKREGILNSKGTFCKIDVDESGRKILRHRGTLKEGYDKFKTLCDEVYQITDNFSFKNINYPEMPVLFKNTENGDKKDGKKE